MGCAVPTANWAQSSLGFFPFLLPDVVPELLACPSAWLGDPNSPSSAKDAAQDRSSCPCHPGLPHSCRDRTQGAENKVGCASRCSVTLLSPPHAVTWQDRGWHRPCATPVPALLLSRPLWLEKPGREMMLRPGMAVMGCAPPTLPRAGQEARLGWTPLQKQAGRAPRPLFPGAVPIRARLRAQGVGMAHGRDKSSPSPAPCQPCPHLGTPRWVQQLQEGMLRDGNGIAPPGHGVPNGNPSPTAQH